jgi:signal peptidase I
MASYFAFFLVFLSFATGIIWLIDVKVLAPKRRLALADAEGKLGSELDESSRNKIMRQSAIAETAESIFPVVVIITIFRSFLFEPFQIPSGSMKPTLLVGDFILVQKYAYGVKDPVTRTKLIETGSPERGDVVVFKYPEDPLVDFIKRVVGLPGDHIVYRDKTLYIKQSCDNAPDNCEKFEKVPQTLIGNGNFKYDNYLPLNQLKEDLLGVNHEILVNPVAPAREDEYFKQNSTRIDEWIVPQGHYFAMGDNRDNSRDSRYWGFVPDENLVGKAVFIWMSFEKEPNEWPTGVRLDRIGDLQLGNLTP